jgi:hypothetical protein
MSEKGFNPNPVEHPAGWRRSTQDCFFQTVGPHQEAVTGCPRLFSGISVDDYAAISAAARVKEFTR